MTSIEPRCDLKRIRQIRVSSIIRRMRHDEKGAAAVEFGLIALPFMAMIFMVFQVALYYYSVQSLDYATKIGSRQLMVGNLSARSSSEAFKKNIVCANLLTNSSCSGVVVNAYKVATTASGDITSGINSIIDPATMKLRSFGGAASFCLGGPGDFIFLDVSYDFHSIFGGLLQIFGLSGTPIQIRSTNLFRNEPFRSGGMVC